MIEFDQMKMMRKSEINTFGKEHICYTLPLKTTCQVVPEPKQEKKMTRKNEKYRKKYSDNHLYINNYSIHIPTQQLPL